jgi:hypothetical protein
MRLFRQRSTDKVWEMFTASDISSDIVLAKPESGVKQTQMDECARKRQIDWGQTVARNVPFFIGDS